MNCSSCKGFIFVEDEFNYFILCDDQMQTVYPFCSWFCIKEFSSRAKELFIEFGEDGKVKELEVVGEGGNLEENGQW